MERDRTDAANAENERLRALVAATNADAPTVLWDGWAVVIDETGPGWADETRDAAIGAFERNANTEFARHGEACCIPVQIVAKVAP